MKHLVSVCLAFFWLGAAAGLAAAGEGGNIFTGAETGNLEQVKACLAKDPQALNSLNREYMTPLHVAARGNREDLVRFLLAQGANAASRDQYQNTPFILTDNPQIADLLLQAGAKLDDANSEGYTALHWAAFKGNLELSRYLLDKGAQVDPLTKENITPLAFAVGTGNQELVKLFLAHQAKVNRVNDKGETALDTAVAEGHLEIAQTLVDAGADVFAKDRIGFTTLHWAACKDHGDLVTWLLAKGLDVNALDNDGRTPFALAAANGFVETAKILAAHGAKIDAPLAGKPQGLTPLCLAAFAGQEPMVAWLLDQKANPNAATSPDKATPLLLATEQTRLPVVQTLLAHNADVNAQDAEGMTVLHYAAKAGDVDLIRLLLKNHARVNVADKNADTPLHLADASDSLEAVNILLDHGAEVLARNRKKLTPVGVAVASGHYLLAEALANRGGDPAGEYFAVPAVLQLTTVSKAVGPKGKQIQVDCLARNVSNKPVRVLANYFISPTQVSLWDRDNKEIVLTARVCIERAYTPIDAKNVLTIEPQASVLIGAWEYNPHTGHASGVGQEGLWDLTPLDGKEIKVRFVYDLRHSFSRYDQKHALKNMPWGKQSTEMKMKL